MSGSSVRIINASTFGADPATTHMEFPIGNQSLGAGELDLAILGRTPRPGGRGGGPDRTMIIPPIPVPSFGAICSSRPAAARARSTATATPDTSPASRPDPLDYRTLQDHVTNHSLTGHPGGRPLLPDRAARKARSARARCRRRPGGQCYRVRGRSPGCAPRVRAWASVRVRHPVPGQAGQCSIPSPGRCSCRAHATSPARRPTRCDVAASGHLSLRACATICGATPTGSARPTAWRSRPVIGGPDDGRDVRQRSRLRPAAALPRRARSTSARVRRCSPRSGALRRRRHGAACPDAGEVRDQRRLRREVLHRGRHLRA